MIKDLTVTERDQGWVRKELKRDFENVPNGVQHFPLDGSYYCTSQSEFRNIIHDTEVDQLEYRRDEFDCENFAFLFQNRVALDYGLNSVGTVIDYSGGHGYNVVLYENGKTEIFEPQSDGIVSVGDALSGYESYEMERGCILL